MDENLGIKDKAIRRAYFDFKSPAAYSNIKNVYEEARKENKNIKSEDVQKYLQSEPTYTLHKKQRHVFKRLKTVPTGLNTDWQCDLADVQQIAYSNKRYRYIFVCIDVLSRKIYVAPTKSKTSKDMIPMIQDMIQVNYIVTVDWSFKLRQCWNSLKNMAYKNVSCTLHISMR
jgi:hypothetical protein